MMKSRIDFYELGFVTEPARPKVSLLLHSIGLLTNAGYKRIAVCVSEMKEITNSFTQRELGVIDELQLLGVEHKFSRMHKRLEYGSAFIDFYCHDKDKDITQLRGPQFDAAIIKGNPSELFLDMLSFGLRLGDYPLTIKI